VPKRLNRGSRVRNGLWHGFMSIIVWCGCMSAIIWVLVCYRKWEGARGGLVVKALRYKPAGRGFDSR